MGAQSKILNPTKLPKKLLAAIRSESEMLARRYSRLIKPVHEIMQLLAKPLDGGDPDSRRFTYPRQIDNFLLHIPAEKILRLIHSKGPGNFRQLLGLIDYVENAFTPLYSLEELADIISSFRRHLNKNKKRLVVTGYPNTLFKESMWLDSLLNKLYFAKWPAKITPQNDSLKYTWARWTSDHKRREECKYEKADYIPELKEEDVKQLEDARPKVHRVKIKILMVLLDSLEDKSLEGPWPRCLDILKEALDVDDVKFLLRMDRLYDKHRLAALYAPVFPNVACSGGLTDVFMVVGHVEQELRSESHSDIRNYLDSCIRRELSYGSRLDIAKFLRDVIFRNGSESFALINFVDRMLSKDERFWEQFFERAKRDLGSRQIVKIKPTDRRNQLRVSPLFPSPPDLRWDEVMMAISDNVIEVKARGIRRKYHFEDIGFGDRRTINRPDKQWKLLQIIAQHDGEFHWRTKVEFKYRNTAQATVKEIRKKLNALMGIKKDPFLPYRKVKSYKPKFQIIDNSLDARR